MSAAEALAGRLDRFGATARRWGDSPWSPGWVRTAVVLAVEVHPRGNRRVVAPIVLIDDPVAGYVEIAGAAVVGQDVIRFDSLTAGVPSGCRDRLCD